MLMVKPSSGKLPKQLSYLAAQVRGKGLVLLTQKKTSMPSKSHTFCCLFCFAWIYQAGCTQTCSTQIPVAALEHFAPIALALREKILLVALLFITPSFYQEAALPGIYTEACFTALRALEMSFGKPKGLPKSVPFFLAQTG